MIPKAFTLALILCSCLVHARGAVGQRPNVLLIMADDLRDFGGPFSRDVVKTPNLDRLRKRSVSFERAYAQFPVCNPSRTSILTGLRPEKTGIVGNATFFRDNLPDLTTFPQLLRQNGWTTHSYGKILHTANTGEAQRDHWLDVGKSWDIAKVVPPALPNARGEIRNISGGKLPWCEIGILDGTDEEQPDGQTASAAIAAMQGLTSAGKPWLVAAGFHRPHDPFHAPKKYFDLYPREKLVLWEDPADMSKAPPFAIPGGWGPIFALFTKDQRIDYLRAYMAGVSFMDAQVGRLLDTLDRLNQWDNTIVIFMGDHGFHLGERAWWNKTTLFERSCRAPLIIAAPGCKQGGISRTPVEFLDLYPTILEFCGLRPAHELGGNSLGSLLRDPLAPREAAAFTFVTRGAKHFGQSARTARWRYTQWSDGTAELYDHDIDPEEVRDVSEIPSTRAVIAEMKQHIATLPRWTPPRRPSQIIL